LYQEKSGTPALHNNNNEPNLDALYGMPWDLFGKVFFVANATSVRGGASSLQKPLHVDTGAVLIPKIL
jgi:hypothetical protein